MKQHSVSRGILAAVAVGAGIVMIPFPGAAQEKASGPASARPLWRSHFAGRAALAQGTNATRLKLIDEMPVSAGLRAQLAAGLARAPHGLWQKELPAGVTNAADLWRPLFDDLLQAESVLEVRGPAGRTEITLAIQLTDDRARVWSTNLWQLASVWKLGAPRFAQLEGATGWEVKRAQAPNLLQFTRAGQWVVVGLGQDKLSLAPALLRQIASSGRPLPYVEGALFDVQADLPGLAAWFPWLARYGLPPTHLTARGRGEHLRTEVKFQFAGPVRWRSEPWQIPTNLVGEPLTSFTIARGVSSLLAAIPSAEKLGLNPLPNQLCAWGISNEQCRVYWAAPVSNGVAAVQRLALSIPPFMQSLLGPLLGDFFYVSNKTFFAWGGIPFIQPYLQPATNQNQQFVHGGIFPLPPRQIAPPPELYGQFTTRANLLYYDWEITPQRLWSGRMFIDLVNILSKRYPQGTNSASKAWLSAVVTDLWKDPANPSQTVTEITQTAPNELTLVRKSHLGLTGFEMAALSAWLDSPGFPMSYVPPRLVPTGRTNAPSAKGNPPVAPGK